MTRQETLVLSIFWEIGVRISFENAAREHLLRGAGKACSVLETTLGPLGRAVVIQKPDGTPEVVDSGVATVQELSFANPLENAGAQMIREVSQKTSNDAGDGTTTSAVLAGAILQEGFKQVAAGVDPEALQRGLKRGALQVVEELNELRRPVDRQEEVRKIAATAAKGDEQIGSLVAEAMEEVGDHGLVLVEEKEGTDTRLTVQRGMQLESGYVTPDFLTDETQDEVRFQNPYILLCEHAIADARKILPVMKAAGNEDRPLVVIARRIERGALGTMVVNNRKGTVRSVAVEAPGQGPRRKEQLQDVAYLTGATPVFEELLDGLSNLELAHLGEAEEVRVDENRTKISGGKGEEKIIRNLVKDINEELEEVESEYDRRRLKKRRARLVHGIAELEVGGKTPTERGETKSRAADAVSAARAAREEGVVPGGGVALLRASSTLSRQRGYTGEEKFAVELLKRALQKPFRTIVANAGLDPDLALRKVMTEEGSYGYHAEKNIYGDLDDMSIVDPFSILRKCVENATSVAGMVFTTDCLITD